MEVGGTQSYFSEFTDGTLRFLPFDFIREEKLWFGHIRNHRGWLPLNENLSITDFIGVATFENSRFYPGIDGAVLLF